MNNISIFFIIFIEFPNSEKQMLASEIFFANIGILNKTYIGITKKWERNNHPTVRSRKTNSNLKINSA